MSNLICRYIITLDNGKKIIHIQDLLEKIYFACIKFDRGGNGVCDCHGYIFGVAVIQFNVIKFCGHIIRKEILPRG